MRINLNSRFFDEKEFVLAENGCMKATAFKYKSGVAALKIENAKGYFVILPFQGQQIWRAGFCGHELTMKTTFDEPVPTAEYLKTYGGFLLHCGASAFGSPGKDDKHPQHGELPNIPYDGAYLEIGDDYMLVGGSVEYNVSFTRRYRFSPTCRLGKDSTLLELSSTLENLRHSPMDYMYLCHINFRPVDGAELIYSADYKDIKVHKSANASKELDEYLSRLEKTPEIHHKVGEKGQIYDPEICFTVKRYFGDENGLAHTMQYFSEGAFYVSHSVDTLPLGTRWISRTGDEDSMGMILPSTAEHLGYTYAKQNGQLKILPPLGSVKFEVKAGYLEKDKADEMKEKINKMIVSNS